MPKTKSFISSLKKIDIHRVAIGICLIFLGVLIISRTLPALHAKEADASGEVNAQAFGSGEKTDEKKTPTRIIIPAVSIDLEVKTSKIVRGYWEVFDHTAAWGEQSGYPGQPGNQVIFAHARKGLFLPLKDVQMGAKVYVMTDDKWYSYEVKEIKAVYPNQLEVIAPTTDETLTLYTCTGYEDSKRLILVAKRT